MGFPWHQAKKPVQKKLKKKKLGTVKLATNNGKRASFKRGKSRVNLLQPELGDGPTIDDDPAAVVEVQISKEWFAMVSTFFHF